MEKCKNCSGCSGGAGKQDIEQKIANKYAGDRSRVIACLQELQTELGYISEHAANIVSRTLGVPMADVYSIVTFYAQFTLRPKAKYTIEVCMGTACFVCGAEGIVKEIEKQLSLTGEKKWTDDGKFELVLSRCLGCCGLAPVVSINGEVRGHVKAVQVKEILERCE